MPCLPTRSNCRPECQLVHATACAWQVNQTGWVIKLYANRSSASGKSTPGRDESYSNRVAGLRLLPTNARLALFSNSAPDSPPDTAPTEAERIFIGGRPRNPATNRITGDLSKTCGVPTCGTRAAPSTTEHRASGFQGQVALSAMQGATKLRWQFIAYRLVRGLLNKNAAGSRTIALARATR